MKIFKTTFGSLNSFQKGQLDLFSGGDKDYAFSNLFEVARDANPFERIAIAKNFEYVIEVVKVDNKSPWYLCAHDEFCLVMDGQVESTFINPKLIKMPHQDGSVHLDEQPVGDLMGRVIASRGHLVLLPAKKAYRLSSNKPSVVIIQTIMGENTVEKWRDICQINLKDK